MLIELKDVAVNLSGKSILEGINLDLEPGQITLIHGQSGSGLSVLLKTVAGLITPASGQVLYDGVDISSLSEQKMRRLQTRTGFMFQYAALWANMPLASNLHLPLQAKFPDLTTESRQQIIDEALKQFSYSADLKKRPVELSLGQQKFMSFLRAVIPGPEALMLDEPLAGMDRHWMETVVKHLSELRDSGKTLILGSHNSPVLFNLSDQCILIQHGRIQISSQEVSEQ